MLKAFHPVPAVADDYGHVRANGMWYQSWQSGYQDILKRGLPRPSDPRTILAELHSPNVPSFLHGNTAQVPFLVTSAARKILEDEELTGLDFSPVIVAKLATKGERRRSSSSGEPEDVILKSRAADPARAPTLHAVFVTGLVEVRPDFPSGRDPAGWVSPFEPISDASRVDLWRPSIGGQPFAAWAFCSERFRRVCEQHELTNIAFTPLDRFMDDLRSRRHSGVSEPERSD